MNNQIAFYNHKLQFEIDSSDLFQALDKAENVVVIDARTSEAYHQEHIPGAITLPHREMSEGSTASFEKGLQYVVYCDGIGCNASTKGALNMATLGFNVKELMGGLDWWKRDGYGTEGKKAKKGREYSCAC